MRRNEDKLFYGIDKMTVLLYALLVVLGWLNIYAAVYNEQHQNILDISQKYGKQLIWIGGAVILAVFILLMDTNLYTAFSYVFYGVILLACVLVPYLGRTVNGSKSWFRFGDFGVQPAEFMKFATNLALAKFLSNTNIELENYSRTRRLSDIIRNYRSTIIAVLILAVPLVVIKKLQDETGLAIVFLAFIITLYREGLSINYLVFGMLCVVLFVLALVVPFIKLVIWLAVVALVVLLFIRRSKKYMIWLGVIYVAACGVSYGTRYVYNHLPQHQKVRIDVLLKQDSVDVKKEGYNVNQAKIAIGSGGFLGKGYLQGTQTKYEFVPEQETDFIFCTVGEEWGFVGSTIVILLELMLVLRVVFMAERQRSDFSRIYGYGVAAVLFFHLAVNVGMTIGLVPVIGIPLPFFSYGGSSLWSFTILLFIFLKLDANRLLILK